MDILEDLRNADRKGVCPPQNWTTRAADEIERLRNALHVFMGDEKYEKFLNEHDPTKLVTIRQENGHLFRCVCGCNVFYHPSNDNTLYKCNACQTLYSGV